MSIHSCFKDKRFKVKKRCVLKRAERIKQLEKEGKWKEGDSLFGLPKTKVIRVEAPKKEKAVATVTPVDFSEVQELAKPKHKKKSKDVGKIK